MTLHRQSTNEKTNLLLDTHGGYCLALQSLEVSGWEFGFQVRHDAVSVLQHTLSLLLQHGDARSAALPVLHNAQVGKCSFPAATTPLDAANPEEEESATCSQHAIWPVYRLALYFQRKHIAEWAKGEMLPNEQLVHIAEVKGSGFYQTILGCIAGAYLKGKARVRCREVCKLPLPATKLEKHVSPPLSCPLDPACVVCAANESSVRTERRLIIGSMLRSVSAGSMNSSIRWGLLPCSPHGPPAYSFSQLITVLIKTILLC